MSDIRWTGQALTDLLKLPVDQVMEKYGLTKEGVYTKRKRLKKNARKILMRMEQDPSFQPEEHDIERIEALALEDDRIRELLQNFQDAGIPVDPQDAGKVERITFWTQHSVDRETGEPVQVINRYVRMKPEKHEEDVELPPQAVAARITPTRKKPKQSDHKDIFVFSDAQMDFRRIIDGKTGEMTLEPTHDPRAIRLAQMICADLRPEEIWNAGDTIDLASLSRFKPDSDHFHKTIGVSLQAVHDMYAQFRADNPDARIIEVDSNHNMRLRDYLLKNFPQAYDLYRPGDDSEYPVMSYAYLANLQAVGVEYISGYGAAQYEYGLDYYEERGGRTVPVPPIILRHGTESSPNGTTASKVYKNNPDTISVQGHDHDPQMYLRQNRLGQMVGAIIVPPLCKTTGEVSSYHSAVNDKNRVVPTQETWTQGALHIVDYGGQYEFHTITFHDGVAHYRDKEYRAE